MIFNRQLLNKDYLSQNLNNSLLNLEIMGGEGAMMAMITSLKNNSRRKKRTQFDKNKTGGYGNGEKVEFDFPEVTPEVLRTIRDRLQKERRQLLVKRGILFLIITIVLLLTVIY